MEFSQLKIGDKFQCLCGVHHNELGFEKIDDKKGKDIYFNLYLSFTPCTEVKLMSEKEITLKTTQERLERAASGCKDVEGALKILFPEYFEKKVWTPCLDVNFETNRNGNGDMGWTLRNKNNDLIFDNSSAWPDRILLKGHHFRIENNYLILEPK